MNEIAVCSLSIFSTRVPFALWQWIEDANETGAVTARERETEKETVKETGRGIATEEETGIGNGRERGTGTEAWIETEKETERKVESDRVQDPGLPSTGTVAHHLMIGHTEIAGGTGKGAKAETGVERESEVGNETGAEIEVVKRAWKGVTKGVPNGETNETVAMDWMDIAQLLSRSLLMGLPVRP